MSNGKGTMLSGRLTIRLSGARFARVTKLFYPHHRFPPTLNEDDPRVRSNRWLDIADLRTAHRATD